MYGTGASGLVILSDKAKMRAATVVVEAWMPSGRHRVFYSNHVAYTRYPATHPETSISTLFVYSLNNVMLFC